MASLTDYNYVITFYMGDDYKGTRVEGNLYLLDLPLIKETVEHSNLYSKAVIETMGQTWVWTNKLQRLS